MIMKNNFNNILILVVSVCLTITIAIQQTTINKINTELKVLQIQLDSIKTIVKVHDSVINEFPDDDFNTFQPTDN